MLKVGLTGGIGTGKSTVSKFLKDAGFPIIDADVISREVLDKYPDILKRIRKEFGEGFFDWKGEFRRKEFGNHIFRFPRLRTRYEEMIIPYIIKEIDEAFKKLEDKKAKIVILDAPTLIENNLHEVMDLVVVVWADHNTQLSRIKDRDRLGTGEALQRINAQLSLEKKKEYANIIIDNSKDILSTEVQVRDLIGILNLYK
ncbi:dephospho-CoA kinase [Clostridium intestinale]|jgi:dephospho-CoA kinase|uniref:Dephospho-CoA kinase n=2 Tax=Clostridium intestinale TaxID=36845 RepID=U2PW10_9CLOT|nr:dephospho-CoA kinase [Clostridium intestinale]ERK30615.1 dephospho-CoA kinase [Clostridium intestinale URNW]QLY78108.1 dephospho-CoA kinase [Clostridium intestinale]